MKKWRNTIVAATVACLLCTCGMAGCSDQKEQSEKGKEEQIKTFGQVYETVLKNATGKDITGIALKDSGMTGISENKLLDGDVFAKGERRTLIYDATKAVTEATTPTEATCNLQITFQGGKKKKLSDVPFDDMRECEIRFEDGVAFLSYVSVETKEEITTKDAELKLKEKREKRAAKRAARKARKEARKKREAEAAAKAQREAAARAAQQQQAATTQATWATQPQQAATKQTTQATQPQNSDGCIGDDERLLY